MLLAILPIQSCDVTRLWVVGTILVAALPPLVVCGIRKRWQFSLRTLLFAVLLFAVGLSWTREQLVLLLTPQPNVNIVPQVSIQVVDSSAGQITLGVLILSLIFSFAWWSRIRAGGRDS